MVSEWLRSGCWAQEEQTNDQSTASLDSGARREDEIIEVEQLSRGSRSNATTQTGKLPTKSRKERANGRTT